MTSPPVGQGQDRGGHRAATTSAVVAFVVVYLLAHWLMLHVWHDQRDLGDVATLMVRVGLSVALALIAAGVVLCVLRRRAS